MVSYRSVIKNLIIVFYASNLFYKRTFPTFDSKKQNLIKTKFSSTGWSMNDEATTHYSGIIDNMALGFKTLQDIFGKTKSTFKKKSLKSNG